MRRNLHGLTILELILGVALTAGVIMVSVGMQRMLERTRQKLAYQQRTLEIKRVADFMVADLREADPTSIWDEDVPPVPGAPIDRLIFEKTLYHPVNPPVVTTIEYRFVAGELLRFETRGGITTQRTLARQLLPPTTEDPLFEGDPSPSVLLITLNGLSDSLQPGRAIYRRVTIRSLS